MPQQQFQKITDRSIMGRFYNRLEQGEASWANRLSLMTSSDQSSETYGWLGMSPAMTEWIGGRNAKELREFSFRIDNKDYDATLAIKDKDFKRDKTGQIMVRVDELADRANSHPAKLMSALILAGESSICYDGQFFFDTDHVEGDSGTQSNDLSYTVVNTASPTVAEIRDAIMSSIEAQYGFKDDQGEPLNENARSFTVLVPISLWAVAISAVTLPVVADGSGAVSNIIPSIQNLNIEVVPNARLSWTTKFAVFRNDGAVKPFILQEEEPINLDALTEGSDHFYKYKERLYSVDWAGNVGYGYWQHAVLMSLV